MVEIKVLLLDDSSAKFDVEGKTKGQEVCEMVYNHLQLSEGEYFGIQYYDKQDNLCWLDTIRPLNKQLKAPFKVLFRFAVKFYAPDPVQLQEEQTRYLFTLQIRKDLLNGRLVCNENTACLLASYYVQGELGDHDLLRHTAGYLSESQFFPGQKEEHEVKIMELHKQRRGEDPADVDRNILDVARRLDTYGITLYPCRAQDNAALNLSVAHNGVLVFQNKSRVNTFSWAKIRKLSFHRKKFLIKLHPEGTCKDTLEFIMESRDKTKSFWKHTAATHTFFRQYHEKVVAKPKVKILGRGSRYRHSFNKLPYTIMIRGVEQQSKLQSKLNSIITSGRTQKEVLESSKQSIRNDSPFNRSQSLRLPSSMDNSSSSLRPSPRPMIGYGNVETRIIEADYRVNDSLASLGSIEEAGEFNVTGSRNASNNESHDEQQLLEESHTKQNGLSSSIEEEKTVTSDEDNAENENRLEESRPLVNGNAFDVADENKPDTEELSHEDVFGEESSFLQSSSPLAMHKSDDSLNRKLPKGTAYHVAREILQTERTYVKDLEVITIAFRNAIFESDVLADSVKEFLFSNFDPLYDFHCLFLGELQQRLTLWETQESTDENHKIGDIMLSNLMQMKNFTDLIKSHDIVMLDLYKATKNSANFEKLYKEFELQPACYLSLNNFLLKPSQRLVYYKFILQRLVQYYGTGDVDYEDSKAALQEVSEVVSDIEQTTRSLENYQKLIELERDLLCVDNLVQEGRTFVREGCLQKILRSGSQPRMFFLFSDILLYTSKGVTVTNQFKIKGQFSLRSLKVEESEEMHGLVCFTMNTDKKSYMVAATSQVERSKWMEDLNVAIIRAKNKTSPEIREVVLTKEHGDEIVDDKQGNKDEFSSLDKRYANCRTMSTRRVCWFRNTSVSAVEYTLSIMNQLSGELQRKFKTGDRWQKLFVVLTNFCLFFYKSHEDENPLASLPLIGYAVTKPDDNDNISKELVIKLQFKTHVYFFRADSEYSFFRWMEVICSATQNSSRTRLFSRQTSVVP